MSSTPEMSLRAYCVMRALDDGGTLYTATEAVANVALVHPERDWDERRTLAEWLEAERRGEV